jgi:hypothetical protein
LFVIFLGSFSGIFNINQQQMFTKKKKKDPTGFLVCQRAHESVAFIRRYTLPRFCKITKTELGACLVLKEPKSILMLLMKPVIKKKILPL